jgi:hypothetical protein
MKSRQNKSIEITRYMFILPAFLIAVALFTFAITAQMALADEEEDTFEEADIFFELNDTDEDLGIHALIDGDAWKNLQIFDPEERKMLKIKVKGRLKRQGLTEIAFESDEPEFTELPPEEFFERFPEGEYGIEGVTLEGDVLESTAEVTHVMPAHPDTVMISGVEAVEGCEGDLPLVSEPVVISWDPVTESHPEVGVWGVIEVVQYQIVLEREEPELLVYSVDLPPDVTEVSVPEEFTALGDEFKLEIIVKEESGNKTAVEGCFEIDR